MTPAEELAQYLGAKSSQVDGTKIVPMLCEREEAGSKVLGRQGWLFELKLDGVRIIADKTEKRVALSYRKLRDATESYAEIREAMRSLAETRLVLDGEIVAFDEQGRPDFQRLGHRIQASSKKGLRSPTFVPVVYVVFDVLAIGPYDVRGFPIEARKEILTRIVPAEGAANGLIRLHPTFESGVELFRLCQEHRLEGVVAKRRGSAYKAGERTSDWLKIKAELDAEFVVIGWTEGESDRARLGALDLGAYEGDRLVFRGRVGSGLDVGTIDVLLERLQPIEVDYPVAEGKYSPKPKRHHCLPELVVSVRYGGFSLDPSGARFLRFPVFRGVRPDVDPRDCTAAPDDGAALTREPKWTESSVAGRSPTGDTPASPEGGQRRLARSEPKETELPSAPPRGRRIHVTRGTQTLFGDGTTKDALCTYFESVAPALLRQAHGRACSLLRPDGSALWPPPKWTPKFVRTTSVRADRRETRGYVIDSVDALLFAVEAGSPVIQHGPFKEDCPDVADFVAVRVTTSESSGSKALTKTAHAVRDLASEIGLPAVAIAAGVRAIEVLVGVGAAPSLAAAPLATLLARLASDGSGAGVSIEASNSVAMAFAPCAGRPGGPLVVAVPLDWDELDGIDLAQLGLAAGVERSAEQGAMLDRVTGARVDVAVAAKALERIVAARMP
jgi:bifunctional non-homologous end joining protein LigD